MTVIPAHKRERQEDQEFKVRLGNIERPCPKKRNSSNKKKNLCVIYFLSESYLMYSTSFQKEFNIIYTLSSTIKFYSVRTLGKKRK
jgi:hypothetical protein